MKRMQGLAVSPYNGCYRLRGQSFESAYDIVVVCTPAPAAAKILRECSPEAAGLLSPVRYSSSRIVYLAYKGSECPLPDGGGFVVADRETAVIDACSWVSNKFDFRCPDDQVLLRCAIHEGRRERAQASDEETVLQVHSALKEIMDISGSPTMHRVFRATKAMPQLEVGHERRLRAVSQEMARHPGLFIASAFSGGIGIPDCVRTAQDTTEQVLDEVCRRQGSGLKS